MNNEERLVVSRNMWQNAANNLHTAIRMLLDPHQPCDCFPCQAISEYRKAKQGVE